MKMNKLCKISAICLVILICFGSIHTVEAANSFVIPDSSIRYLTDADVEDLTLKGLNYAKNEIYARRGRKFASRELQDYFNSQDWYVGVIEPGDFTDDMLNQFEKSNAGFLYNIEFGIAKNGYLLDQPGNDDLPLTKGETTKSYAYIVDYEYDYEEDTSSDWVDYSVVRDFIFEFPMHGRDEYSLPGRYEVHEEEDLIEWLEAYGWTDYVNMWASEGYPDDYDAHWYFEAYNGVWKISGRPSIEWHEKGDDDYVDGCSVSIGIVCTEEEARGIYKECKDILSDYFYYSYQDIKKAYDDGSVTVWSGYFDEDCAARLLQYDDHVSIAFYDSLQPNTFGVFWNGVPLQINGEVVDEKITLSTMP